MPIHNIVKTRQEKIKIIQEHDKRKRYQYPAKPRDYDYNKLADNEIDNLFLATVLIDYSEKWLKYQ